MQQDLYEILEIPDNANDIWIRRAYDRKRESLAHDTTLNAAQRQAAIGAVEHAFSILSNPAMREQYDNDRLTPPEQEPATAKRSAFTPARLIIYGTVILLVIAAAWAYWRYVGEQERIRLQEERGAAEIAVRQRELEAREKAQRAAIQNIGNTIERQQARQQSIDQSKPQTEPDRADKSDEADIKADQAAIQAERQRVQQERRAEANRRLQQTLGK